jgi:hypothetical protein
MNIGSMMYEEAPDIPSGRMLYLNRPRLTAIRRSVMREVLRIVEQGKDVIINSHATFRWHHGLFNVLDWDLLARIQPTQLVTLVDDFHTMIERLNGTSASEEITPLDILMWREEEIQAMKSLSEVLALMLKRPFPHSIIARGRLDEEHRGIVPLSQLIAYPERKRVYSSFPMTNVMDKPDTLAKIRAFVEELQQRFVTFDPKRYLQGTCIGSISLN